MLIRRNVKLFKSIQIYSTSARQSETRIRFLLSKLWWHFQLDRYEGITIYL